MNCKFKIVMSECGKELAVFSCHKFRFIRPRNDGLLKWLCSNKRCYARISIDVNKLQVNAVIGENNHEEITPRNIERQVLRRNCKRKASD